MLDAAVDGSGGESEAPAAVEPAPLALTPCAFEPDLPQPHPVDAPDSAADFRRGSLGDAGEADRARDLAAGTNFRRAFWAPRRSRHRRPRRPGTHEGPAASRGDRAHVVRPVPAQRPARMP